MNKISVLLLSYLFTLSVAQADQQFPQYLFCISWMDLKTELHEKKLDEYAMAQINFKRGNWGFEVTVIENRLNSLQLENYATASKTQGHSVQFPYNHLSLRLETNNEVATLDCELRFKGTLEL